MTEISFGDVVTAVIEEIGTTECELNAAEREDADAAAKHYQRNVADRLRRLFDQVEARIERGETGSKEVEAVKTVLKDFSKKYPEVRAALMKYLEEE